MQGGNTNAVTGGAGGGGYSQNEVLTAVNRSGKTISAGDKVWINKNVNDVVHSYNSGTFINGLSFSISFVDRTGFFGWGSGNCYAFSETEAVVVGNTPYTVCTLRYGEDGAVFVDTRRIDSKAMYELSYEGDTGSYYIGGNYIARPGENVGISTIDVATGDLLDTWRSTSLTWKNNLSFGFSIFELNGKFYSFNGFTEGAYKLTLNDEDKTIIHTPISGVSATLYPIAATRDGKYVICSTEYYFARKSSGSLRIVKVVDEDTFRVLESGEMHKDMRFFYTQNCALTYNPYTGILTATSGTNYVVMRYHNGQWHKIIVDLGVSDTFQGPLTFSDDMMYAVASLATKSLRYFVSKAGSLYEAQYYEPVRINESTIVGKALTSAEPYAEMQVEAMMPEKIQISVSTNADDAYITIK